MRYCTYGNNAQALVIAKIFLL